MLVGTPAAYLLATRRFRGRVGGRDAGRAAAGAAAGGGRDRAAGGARAAGAVRRRDRRPELVLTTAGVIVALTFVSAPFYMRQAQAGFEAMDRRCSTRRGRSAPGEARTFLRVAIPSAGPSLVAGLALAWGRALGEFGATLMFAGSFRGITQTVPLAIYERFSTDFTGALALSAVLVGGVGGAAAGGQAAERLGVARRCCALRRATRLGAFAPRRRARGPRRRVPGAGRAVRGGQDDVLRVAAGLVRPERGRVVCGDEVWLDIERGVDVAPERRRLRLRLPGVRAVRAPAGVAERRLPAARDAAGGAPRARARAARALRDRRARRRAAADAVGRRAPAGGGGAGAGARPAALLLDEPLSALDTRSRAAAGRELGSRARGGRRAGAARHPRLHRGGAARRRASA